MLNRMSKFRRAGISIALVSALTLAACGSDTKDGAEASGDVPELKQLVADSCNAVKDAQSPVSFEAPGAAIDAKKIGAGKKIFFVNLTGASQTIADEADALKDSASKVGMDVTLFDGGADVPTFNAGVRQAIAEKADVIVLAAILPDLVKGPLEEARKAGIKVIDNLNGQPDGSKGTKLSPLVDGRVSFDFVGGGILRLKKAICDTDGNLDGLFMSSNEQPTSRAIEAEMKKFIAANCPDTCKMKYVDVPIAQWQTGTPVVTNNALQSNPGLNYIIPVYDGNTLAALPTLLAKGVTPSKVKVASFNATDAVRPYVIKGQVSMDIGPSNSWAGWQMTDLALRLLAGKDVRYETTPIRMITPKMADIAPGIKTEKDVFGDSYVAGFEKLWGLN